MLGLNYYCTCSCFAGRDDLIHIDCNSSRDFILHIPCSGHDCTPPLIMPMSAVFPHTEDPAWIFPANFELKTYSNVSIY